MSKDAKFYSKVIAVEIRIHGNLETFSFAMAQRFRRDEVEAFLG